MLLIHQSIYFIFKIKKIVASLFRTTWMLEFELFAFKYPFFFETTFFCSFSNARLYTFHATNSKRMLLHCTKIQNNDKKNSSHRHTHRRVPSNKRKTTAETESKINCIERVRLTIRLLRLCARAIRVATLGSV